MAIVHLICGFLGAGKTTFSKQMEKEGLGIRLNADEECMTLFESDVFERNWGNCFDVAVESLNLKALKYLKEGRDVIFDCGYWSKASRSEAINLFKKTGVDVKLYYIYAPDEVLKKRISMREGKIAESNFKHFEELKKLFEPPSEDEMYILINNF